MSQELHRTNAPEQPPPPLPLVYEFKKQIPVLVLAVLVAFATSWWNSQKSQSDFQHRIEILEKRAETNASNISNNSTALQNNAIRIAEINIIQTNTLEQIRELKSEQAEIKAMLKR